MLPQIPSIPADHLVILTKVLAQPSDAQDGLIRTEASANVRSKYLTDQKTKFKETIAKLKHLQSTIKDMGFSEGVRKSYSAVVEKNVRNFENFLNLKSDASSEAIIAQQVVISKGMEEFSQITRDIAAKKEDTQVEFMAARVKNLISNRKSFFEERLQECIEETAIILRISESSGRAVETISLDEIKTFRENEKKSRLEQIEKNAQQLIDEERKEEFEKKQKSSRVAKGKKVKANKTTKKTRETANENVSKVKEKSTSSKINFKAKYLADLHLNSSKFKELPRVTKRWITKDPKVIRLFEDKDGQERCVLRYQNLPDDQIEDQRCKHFLPGTELLHFDSYNKKVYTFPSDRGFGMFARLQMEKETRLGIIYIGLGADGVIFHKYFEEMKDGAPSSVFVDPIKDSQKSVKQTDPDLMKNDSEWQSIQPYIIDIDSTGVIDFKYPGEHHSVSILPIRKDLLNPDILKEENTPHLTRKTAP